REGDEGVPMDKRTALANNNKADLFISLHANASVRPEVHGAQVLSLNGADYQNLPGAVAPNELPVPVASGGSRSIDIVPWDLAQLPYVERSAGVAAVLVQQLGARNVPLNARPAVRLP